MMLVKVQGKEYGFSFAHMCSAKHLWGVGVTVVYVTSGNELASEVAYCSRKDDYDEERGEKEALKKFMRLMPWSREDRRKVWQAYFKMKWVEYETFLCEEEK
jgi:hypothetical protein